jgi:hypothetical protein
MSKNLVLGGVLLVALYAALHLIALVARPYANQIEQSAQQAEQQAARTLAIRTGISPEAQRAHDEIIAAKQAWAREHPISGEAWAQFKADAAESHENAENARSLHDLTRKDVKIQEERLREACRVTGRC